MLTSIGVVTLLVGLVAWLGQTLAFVSPALAVRLGVLEPEEDLDPALYVIETRAMGLTDILLAWTLPAAALLMLVGHPAWPYLALIGAGVFIYFSLVTTLARMYLKRQGRLVGRPASERAAYAFSAIWILCSLAMIMAATAHLLHGTSA